MKRFLSLCLTAALMLSVMSMTSLAQKDLKSIMSGTNNDKNGVTLLDYIELETSMPIQKVQVKNGHNGSIRAQITEVVKHDNVYFTEIEIEWELNWPQQKTGAVFEDTILCSVQDSGIPIEIPCRYKITGDPVAALTEESEDLYFEGPLEAGKSYILNAELADRWNLMKDVDYSWSWSIEQDGGEKFASITPLGKDADGLVDRNKHESSARLSIIAEGVFSLNVQILDENGEDLGYGASYEETRTSGASFSPLPKEKFDEVLDAITRGDEAISLDVSLNEAITSEQLAAFQSAANGKPVPVSLTFDGQQKMSLTFDANAVDPSWQGSFSPAFTASPPQDAINLGYNTRHGSWLNFYYSGDLPAPMTVAIDVGHVTFPTDTTTLKVWYYDEDEERLVEQPIEVDYNPETKIATFTLEHFSAYAVYPEGVDPNENLVPPSSKRSAGGSGNTEIKQNRENRLNTFATVASKISSLPTREVTIGGETFTASILTANSSEIPYIYYDVMERIAGRENLVLEIILEDGKTALVPATRLPKPEIYRIYYTLPDLAKLA